MREIDLLSSLNAGHRRVLMDLAGRKPVYTVRSDKNVANVRATVTGSLSGRKPVDFGSSVHEGSEGLHVKPREVGKLLLEGLVANHRFAPSHGWYSDLGRLGELKLTAAGKRFARRAEETEKP